MSCFGFCELFLVVSFITVQYELCLAASFITELYLELCLAVSFITELYLELCLAV